MQDYSFTVTGYAGFEDEVLGLRNANRSKAQTRGYLDWRYRGLLNAPEPKVFWIKSSSGRAVGMSSLIFRPYWVNDRPLHLAVLGDISLDASLRGKGLGQKLLHFVTRYIDEHLPDCVGFVIPNSVAKKSLSLIGWRIGGKLIPHVFLLDSADKLHELVRNRWLATWAARRFRAIALGILRLNLKERCSMELIPAPDDSFEALWQNLPKVGLIVRDMGSGSLAWRYVDHPHHKFRFAKFTRAGDPIGFVIFSLSPEDHTGLVYDMVVRKQGDVKSIVAAFLMHCFAYESISTVRLLMNDDHPYCRGLWALGFVPRKAAAVFQVYTPKNRIQGSPSKWAITWGD
ncbi:MAG: GNAT family N-acetyltransferase, partial [Nitrososphaera sp.]|nr:GNAT family N-acetyltransferase [Nitrososphaera sp.]